ncbi:hypothetical protein QBC47DRAFT_422630 [Echria macrotheca]|uniref:Prolyl 4-hydroxylase alpha subunit domain-containing protein n=1 Tax=Echria macrotheca TaxID=438768 RepID=A0AAJ0FCX8_9PEZI|nr:hypothetical protein QBC47DRAFT_422630 [Echria macrotheca]
MAGGSSDTILLLAFGCFLALFVLNGGPTYRERIHVLSKDPFVIYIPSFLTADEAREDSDSEFADSKIRLENGTAVLDTSFRLSKTACLQPDKQAQCILDRARSFQGFGSHSGKMERLQVVKPIRGIAPSLPICTLIAGGGTNFPMLDRPAEEEWCEFLDSRESAPEGVTFKPIITGNAVYWENLLPSGDVHPKSLHTGMPVTSGLKIGLNIWTQKKMNRDKVSSLQNK